MAVERYTTQQMINAIRQTRGLVTVAARMLGCDPNTVRNYIRRHPTVAQALEEERERMTDLAELALFNRIQAQDAWAVCFYLKTQGKGRGYVERQEITGKEGEAIETRSTPDLSKLTPEERELLIQLYDKCR